MVGPQIYDWEHWIDAPDREANCPETWTAMPEGERDACKEGDFVLVGFGCPEGGLPYRQNCKEGFVGGFTPRPDQRFSAERMWVEIVGTEGESLIGSIKNDPFAAFPFGHHDQVRFPRTAIIQKLADEVAR